MSNLKNDTKPSLPNGWTRLVLQLRWPRLRPIDPRRPRSRSREPQTACRGASPNHFAAQQRLGANLLSRHVGCATGFTILELLVVIAIVGLLVSLTIPAVQSSREASRRTSCSNNLRQIGLAFQMHLQQRQVFPPGVIEWRASAADSTKRQLAWAVHLLPFLEQQNVFDQLDLGQAFDSQANARAAAMIVSVFVCPTSARGTQRVEGRGPCDYGGIYGERIQGPNQPPKGIMVHDQAFGAAQVRDGLSSTLIVAEDTGWADGQWINGRNVFDQAYAINAAPAFENDIRSDHAGGAQGVMADGAVRFLSEQIDLRPLAAICTRAGGELLSAGDY